MTTAWRVVLLMLANGPASTSSIIAVSGYERTAVYDALRRLARDGYIARIDGLWYRVADDAPDELAPHRAAKRDVTDTLAACLVALGDDWRDVPSLVPAAGRYRQQVYQRLTRLHRLGLVERNGNLWRRA